MDQNMNKKLKNADTKFGSKLEPNLPINMDKEIDKILKLQLDYR